MRPVVPFPSTNKRKNERLLLSPLEEEPEIFIDKHAKLKLPDVGFIKSTFVPLLLFGHLASGRWLSTQVLG